MPSIENRIVQMQFDNTAFERRLADTLKSIDKLNQTLANAGSKNGLTTLSESVRGFNLNPISASIDGVSAKFLAMSTIAVTVLSTIVSKAIDSGARIVSALSLDPVIAGFQEYQTQIGAIQTILANTQSKGTGLDDVNAALDLLNEYSDRTIYNFTEMTRNIGTFTAAGVDLDTSVQSIKGIANLAAISGSNSQQASTAMYQLSQAIATGTVKLIDWNSVVNAGMGGEVFQKALFETGKTMGTIADVDMTTTFEQWTDAGNSFRGSLETGWLTAEVLTNTLKGFTGELTRDQILAMGYTEEQAIEIERLGKLGVDSATKVRTLKQLLETTKEALGSGWAQSFRIIFGDFEEATELFTRVSDALGGFINKNAEARNALLQGWEDLGGRWVLIDALKNAFVALGEILAPIKEAFHEIFPPLTAQRLADLTLSFHALIERLRPSEETVENIRRIFTGFFAALEIGWTVLKETAKFVGELFTSLTGAGSGAFLEFAAKIGDFFTNLNTELVTEGGIAKFFDELPGKLQPAIDKFVEIKDAAIEFFDKFMEKAGPVVDKITEIKDGVAEFLDSFGGGAMDTAAEATGRFSDRFGGLRDIITNIGDVWEPFKTALNGIKGFLDEIWLHISTWFGELGGKLSEAFDEGDFDAVVDLVNVGLLGGIAAILLKFFKEGFKFDLGDGLFSNITSAFGELTGVLSAMQTQIKADALLKIAMAVGILSASVLVLSLIDSAALTKALLAMSVGFGQLIGAFMLLNTMAIGPTTAVKLAIMSAGLILLAGAMLVLSAAVLILSTMDWGELAKGLVGVAALLLMLTVVSGPLSANSSGMITAGLGMIGMAVALVILAGAVKLFSMMSWEDMAQGLIGIGVGLGIIVVAMKFMPPNMLLTGLGLIAVALALSILAGAVALFATMSIADMAQGLIGVGIALAAIGLAMGLFPMSTILIGPGLIAVAIAMTILAGAVKLFATMSWGEMAKGLVGLGGALLVLAVGAHAMSGALVGAIAITVMAVALGLLVEVIKEMSKIRTGDLIKALLGIAAVLAVLGIAAALLSPVTGALLGLGVALILVGAGFALFGLGALAVAKAIEILARVGGAGIEVVITLLDAIIDRVPAFIAAFATGFVELAQIFFDAAPVLIEGLTIVIGHILDSLIELIPKIGETISTILATVITVLRERIPEFIQLGIDVIMALLTGIRDNIGQIVTIALEIITNFLQGIADNIPMVIEAAVNLITSFIDGIANNIQRVIDSGVNLIVSFLQGISDNISKVTEAVGEVITEFIAAVVALHGDIIAAGFDALIEFLSGITDNLVEVVNAVGDMIIEFVTAVGNKATDIADAGFDTLIEFLGGITDNLINVTVSVALMIIRFIQAVGNSAKAVATAGAQTLVAFLAGIAANVLYVVEMAFVILIAFINGLADAINRYAPQLREAGKRLAGAIIDGATFGLASRAKEVADKVGGVFSGAINQARGLLGIGSPSKVFMDMGFQMIEGAAVGISSNSHMEEAAVDRITSMTDKVKDTVKGFSMDLSDTADFNPVITPVLDLTQAQKDARLVSGLIPSELTVGTSNTQAQTIVLEGSVRADEDVAESRPPVVQFVQNNTSPEALSAGDIYRHTKNLLQLEKERLVPTSV